MNLTNIWQNSQEEIKEKVGSTSYDTWFSTIHVKEKNENTLLIEAPDDFFKNWIIEHYKKFIYEIVNKDANRVIELEFSVNSHILKEGTQNRLISLEQKFANNNESQSNINPRFTFDNFVIGPSNRFAAAAGLAVAESPGLPTAGTPRRYPFPATANGP